LDVIKQQIDAAIVHLRDVSIKRGEATDIVVVTVPLQATAPSARSSDEDDVDEEEDPSQDRVVVDDQIAVIMVNQRRRRRRRLASRGNAIGTTECRVIETPTRWSKRLHCRRTGLIWRR
jgi:hypothetical protein